MKPIESGVYVVGGYRIELEIDARNLRCPMPLLKTKQALNKVSSGEMVRLLATDAGSVRDIPAYAELSGHVVVRFTVDESGVLEFILQKHDDSRR